MRGGPKQASGLFQPRTGGAPGRSTAYRHGSYLFIGRDLGEQLWQHGRVANVAPRDLDGPNLQRLLIDPEVDLAPQAPLGTAVLPGVPFSLAFRLVAGACPLPGSASRSDVTRGDQEV